MPTSRVGERRSESLMNHDVSLSRRTGKPNALSAPQRIRHSTSCHAVPGTVCFRTGRGTVTRRCGQRGQPETPPAQPGPGLGPAQPSVLRLELLTRLLPIGEAGGASAMSVSGFDGCLRTGRRGLQGEAPGRRLRGSRVAVCGAVLASFAPGTGAVLALAGGVASVSSPLQGFPRATLSEHLPTARVSPCPAWTRHQPRRSPAQRQSCPTCPSHFVLSRTLRKNFQTIQKNIPDMI